MLLARRVKNVTPSHTLAIEAKAKQMKQQGIDVISFSAGEPDFDTPASIKNKAIEALQKGFTKYTPASGTPELRKAISEKLTRENGVAYAPDQVIVSCGAKHSIYNVIQVLIDEGDEVIFSSPYWLSYPEMVMLAGGKSVIIPTMAEHGYKMTPKALEQAMTSKTKLLILNSPSNPTGMIYTESELRALAEVCKKKSIYILSDEIYEKMIYDGGKHFSIGASDSETLQRTITINGASKTYAMTGWRIGYAACPKEIAEAVSSLQSHSTSNPTSFAQAGFLEALAHYPAEINDMLKAFAKRRDLIVKLAGEVPGFKPFRPQGAFYLFCDISGTKLSSMDISKFLLEEARVAVVPGIAFGEDRAIRFSFATKDSNIEEGFRRIQEWMKKR